MSRPTLLGCCLLALLGSSCEGAPQRGGHANKDAGRGHEALAPTHYLGEWFQVATARCRLLSAARVLTEPQDVEPGRLAEDLHVVDLQLVCRNADDAPLAARSALAAAELLFQDDRQRTHVLSTRTRHEQRIDADHVLFEVPAGHDGLLRPHRYDARSGDPRYGRERRNARLLIATEAQRSAIAPWERAHDVMFDRFLDRLARTLATGAPYDTLSNTPEGHEGLERAAALYADALVRFAPKELAVEQLVLGAQPGSAELTLVLEKSERSEDPEQSVRFSFDLALGGGEPSITRLANDAAAVQALACDEARARLDTRSRAAIAGLSEEALCNALGTFVPAPCARDGALLAEALEVGTRCVDHTRFALANDKGAPPSDFRVELRRGRSLTSLAPAPHYTLTIEHDGSTWYASESADQPPREGRSSRVLVAALHRRLRELRFFERPGRGDGQLCKERDVRGDTLIVRAGGRERGVRDRDGCRGPFSHAELEELRRAVEHVAAADLWTLPPAPREERDSDVWIVAAE